MHPLDAFHANKTSVSEQAPAPLRGFLGATHSPRIVLLTQNGFINADLTG
jgi:hypothetical protein